MRALRVAPDTIQLVLPDLGPAACRAVVVAPEATRSEVLTLLARLIARGVDQPDPAPEEEGIAMSEATTVLVSAKIGPVHLGRDAMCMCGSPR